MIEHLRFVLSNTNDWLKFAEAKNAAAAAFAAAIAAACISMSTSTALNKTDTSALAVAVGMLSIGALLALASFLPILELPFLSPKREPAESDNLLFFGHIADYGVARFLEKTATLLEKEGHSSLEEDYAEQIVINARIAVRKYRLFSAACSCILGGLAVLMVGGIVHIISR